MNLMFFYNSLKLAVTEPTSYCHIILYHAIRGKTAFFIRKEIICQLYCENIVTWNDYEKKSCRVIMKKIMSKFEETGKLNAARKKKEIDFK